MTVPYRADGWTLPTTQHWAALTRLIAAELPRRCAGGQRAASEAVESELPPSYSARPSPTGRLQSSSAGDVRTSNDAEETKLPSPDSSLGPDEKLDPDDNHVEAQHAETWALVRKASDGDGEAFGALYDRYVDSVFRFIYYRVNDRALAEDFTSETFLRALRRISTVSYQGRDNGAWFMTIARNIVFDHAKSARFRLESPTAEIRDSVDSDAGPESAVLTRLTNTRLLEAVNTLNDEQKECIVLRFLTGLSVAETAEVMGKNDGAIKALQHRAVKRLASLVGDELR